MPWTQHVAFLDDASVARQVRIEAAATVKRLAPHPASLLFAVGNEIPPSVVRWHGQRSIERFLSELARDVKAAAPSSLLTYVNFPPTEYLDLDPFDVCAFNVYLHRKADLRAYLGKLQHVAWQQAAAAGRGRRRQRPRGRGRPGADHRDAHPRGVRRRRVRRGGVRVDRRVVARRASR
jgi:hypothetical protein